MRDLDDYQKKYYSEPGEALMVRHRRKHILSIMSRYPHNNILEIGCGNEPLFMYFSDYESMTIVEPGHIFASNAINKALENQSNIKIIEDYFEKSVDLLFELNHGFDYIIVSSLLHELESPEELMESLYTISSPDTIIHINVPNANSFHRLIAQKMGIINDVHELSSQQKKMQRNKVYDMRELVTLCNNYGFTVIEKGSFVPKFLTGEQIDKMIESEIVDNSYFDGLDSIIDYIPEYGAEIYIQMKRK